MDVSEDSLEEVTEDSDTEAVAVQTNSANVIGLREPQIVLMSLIEVANERQSLRTGRKKQNCNTHQKGFHLC